MDTRTEHYQWNGETIPVTIKYGKILSNRTQQTLDFSYKSICVSFYYLHEDLQAYFVFYRICKNIDEYGKEWETHFYYRNKKFYQDNEIIDVFK